MLCSSTPLEHISTLFILNDYDTIKLDDFKCILGNNLFSFGIQTDFVDFLNDYFHVISFCSTRTNC